ncbi:endonuclease/exonuclease/phosphatase family protein [Clostridium ganghwense]|uniref:Endonuclease/exonuclease/phosphatase family protein n=1 Tax=Clostridium ganghwense TaxID=312089 RepID=A0ABT4CJS7_9CLOT|nr:endonuclease/exonuclease/phosphatase family protein [Clostridium ganghwense]MCY6369300.1 endonuclease/exonuclease/phosphatase family protein [Clostridium ganghwense]
MKLLTLNCHSWQEDNQLEKIQTIVNDIKEKSYDVIAIQEVSQLINEKSIDNKIKANNFALVLLNELNKLDVSDYKMVWDFSHIGYDVYEEGLALLTKHDIVKEYSFFISRNHDINYWKTRKIVGASINIDGQLMDFYSCHLGWWIDEEEPFKNQVDCLFKNIAFDKPTFLMGDFNNNAFIRDEGYDYLIEKGMYDTFSLAKQKDKGITVKGKIDGWDENKNNMRLDLILVNEEIDVKSSQVIFNGKNKEVVSDHYGVEIEI